jgi:cobalt/nickel transport system permease protein
MSGEAFLPAARILAITYVPLALIEALTTGAVIAFLQRVDPEILLRREVSRV